MSNRFQGTIAIVTGAASGIGRKTALLMAAQGARVLVVDRNADGAREVCEIGNSAGGRMVPLGIDLVSSDAPNAVFAACTGAFSDRPEILINNAGMGNAKPAKETTDEDWDRWLDVNLRITFRLSREALSAFPQGGGCIVNVASIFGLSGFQGSAPYSAAKAGIVGLTQQMAADYGIRGIRINAVAPGLIATPATAARIASNPLFREGIMHATPLNRFGAPIDIARAIAFLSSEEASFITGQVLAVDGGWSTTHYRSPESLEA